MTKRIIIVLFVFIAGLINAQQNQIIGKVIDKNGQPIEMVDVVILKTGKGISTDKSGNYAININTKTNIQISFSSLSYKKKVILIDSITSPTHVLNITLPKKINSLDEINIVRNNSSERGIITISPIILNSIPNIAGNKIQTLLKTLPGVSSTNELSANYSVRGGNFDENLVYINDFEVYKPVLLQTGRQEGLNMINSDLVSEINFSAGGFGTEFGDKMSSVLDIKYKNPDNFKLSTDLSLLGASMHSEGLHLNNKLSHLIGIRYKNSKYLLNSLETEGEYKPNFFDLQLFINYKISSKLKISLISYYSNNNYLFFPKDKESSFGTVNDALSLYIDYEGQEKDKYSSLMNGLSFQYKPNNRLYLKLQTAAYTNHEEITYDIKGRYSLNQLDKDLGSSNFGDSILNLGIGSFLSHARNYFDANIYNILHKGKYQINNTCISWASKYQFEELYDKINEWQLMDSAGYSIPYNNENIILAKSYFSENKISRNRIQAYIQIKNKGGYYSKFNAEYGIRTNWNDYNNEFLISPRFALNYYPKRNRNLLLRFGSGLYYQSIYLKEIIDNEGIIHKSKQSPSSIHFVGSADYNFIMLHRPFHFKSELYYKLLKNQIPYNIENISIKYMPHLTANGYATGVDLRLNGEFVEGVESWFSVSVMKSVIDTENDTIAEQPLPNDHTINVSLFFQDYLPGNKNFKVYLALMYLTGTPFGIPNDQNYIVSSRMTDYKRVDIGFTYIIKSENKKQKGDFFNSVKLSIEAFNLLGFKNTISHNWIKVVPNSSLAVNQNYPMYAVPNYLSARRFNLRLIIEI